MRTRFVAWAASALFLHRGIVGLDPQWPMADALPHSKSLDSAGVAIARVGAAGDTTSSSGGLDTPINELIRQVPICILGSESWAGELGDTLLFRVHEITQNTVSVGYFAYWSTERPWGKNALTRWFIPALAIDAFYSHLLFVLPGIQRLQYGPGDVEGVRIKYAIKDATHLIPISIVADNEQHREEIINISEALDDAGRVLLSDRVWSHQLGGHDAVMLARAGAKRHCYERGAVRRLTDNIVAAFRLGSRSDPRRAGPAWASHAR